VAGKKLAGFIWLRRGAVVNTGMKLGIHATWRIVG
jgi:hypothetical protein